MRTPIMLTAAALAVTSLAGPAIAKDKVRYEYGGNYYESLEQCQEAKKKAKKKGAIVGAAGGAATTAIFGGNLGEAALGAGVGALAGGVIGNKSKKC